MQTTATILWQNAAKFEKSQESRKFVQQAWLYGALYGGHGQVLVNSAQNDFKPA